VKETIIASLKIIAPLSVALIVFAQGLGITPAEVIKYFKERPGLMLRSLIASLVLVPAVALAIILVLKPSPELAVGLAILVACPPAPLMLKAATNLGKGNAAFMASIHLSFALLAFLTVPAVLYLISQPLGFQAEVDLGTMGWILARTILIPVGLGLIVRGFAPNIADKLSPIAGKVGSIGLLIVIVFALIALYPALLAMDGWSYLVIAAVSVSALGVGHLLGPTDPHEKTTLAVESGVRHPVLAITIAATNFTPEKAMPVLVPCILVFIFIAFVYMFVRGRMTSAAEPTATA
jgi:BASS family bile acid:Na+ symporter